MAVFVGEQGGPVLPAVEGFFDLVETDTWPADGELVAVVVPVAIGDDRVELAGVGENTVLPGWGVILAEP